MKKHCCILFTVVFVLGLFMVTTNAQAAEIEVPKIQLSGLIEVGGVWQDIDYEGAVPEKEDDSDICLTTVELTAEAEVNEWVNVVAVFLYEDPTFNWSGGGETTVEIDEAMVTIGNTEEFPVYVNAGKMYVPFGALLTHFPDDPLYDGPLTLLLGETLEKSVLVGAKYQGFSVSGYGFNGDMDELLEDENVKTFGVDLNFSFDDEAGFDILIGGSYISNIADSDVVTERLDLLSESIAEADPLIEHVGLKDYLGGAAGYVHVGFKGFFVEGEYMAALDDLELEVIETTGTTYGVDTKDQPYVWNVEAGYNLDWGKNLEIALQYAGSNEAEFLGFPETRYGICLNQELFEDVIVSLGYLHDEYETDDVYLKVDDGVYRRDDRDLIFAQIAIEF
jgi:hypothetical protein